MADLKTEPASTEEPSASTGSRRDPFAWAIENPDQCAIWSFMIGFALCVVAIMLHVGSVKFDGSLMVPGGGGHRIPGLPEASISKEVGYLFAPNWSLFGVMIVPPMIWFGLRMLGAMEGVLESAVQRGMIRDENFDVVPQQEILDGWARHRRRNRLIFGVMFILVMAYMLSDWWGVVAHPLLAPANFTDVSFNDQTMEFDWSVAAIFDGSDVGRWPLLVFTLVAYILLAGFAPAFAFAAVISALHFISFTVGLGKSHRWRLAAVPLKDEDDRHCGFDAFAPFFTMLLLGGLCVLFGLQFMVLQNAYLRAPEASMIDFLIEGKVQLSELPLSKYLEWFFEPIETKAANPQTGFAYLLFPFVCVVAIGASWIMLRTSAVSARRFSLRHLARLSSEIGQHEDQSEAKLKAMSLWPVGWLKLNELIGIMLILLISLVSYRLLFIPVVALGILAGDKCKDLILRKKN